MVWNIIALHLTEEFLQELLLNTVPTKILLRATKVAAEYEYYFRGSFCFFWPPNVQLEIAPEGPTTARTFARAQLRQKSLSSETSTRETLYHGIIQRRKEE